MKTQDYVWLGVYLRPGPDVPPDRLIHSVGIFDREPPVRPSEAVAVLSREQAKGLLVELLRVHLVADPERTEAAIADLRAELAAEREE